jgi:hypothetical protein
VRKSLEEFLSLWEPSPCCTLEESLECGVFSKLVPLQVLSSGLGGSVEAIGTPTEPLPNRILGI